MVEAVAEYEYEAQEDDELSFKPGDVITNIVKQDGGWWEGDFNGQRGMFPDNFVKETPSKKKVPPKQKPGGHVAELANKLGSQGGIKVGQPPVVRRGQTNAKKTRAKVAFSYTPENEDELSLEVGEIVEILKQEEEGWWEGRLASGKVGMIPSNFVEIVEDGDVDKSGDEGNAETKEITGKKVKGVGLGNIFSDGPIKLRQTVKQPPKRETGKEDKPNDPKPLARPEKPSPGEKVPPMTKKAAPPPVPTEPQKEIKEAKQLDQAKVLFSYTAENEDELTLEEGDIVVILEKELEDAGWWKGEVNGKIGVFPDNFVELIPSETEKPRKPPPPVVSTGSRPAPQRPPDVSVPDKEPTKAAPSLPKKSLHPPPLGKKPLRPADPKLMAQTDDHKVKESQKDADGFDSVETSEKLTHPTANRVKAPQRRPPSSLHKEQEEDQKTGPQEPPARVARPPPPVHKEDRVKTPTTPVTPAKGPPTLVDNAKGGTAGKELEEIRREFEQLRANTVSRQQYQELQGQLAQLRKEFSDLKQTSEKQIFDLMSEIDEEKKIRMSTQVELERIRKLVTKQ